MTMKKKTKTKTPSVERPRNKAQDNYNKMCIQALIDALNYAEQVKQERQQRAKTPGRRRRDVQ
jgi:hypothetical protein